MLEPVWDAVPAVEISATRFRSHLFSIPEVPFWFLPSPKGQELMELIGASAACSRDDVAMAWRQREGISLDKARHEVELFLSSFPDMEVAPYPGRSVLGEPDQLKELWFHVTDSCNLRCRHCLFGDNLRGARRLDAGEVAGIASEAASLGCRLFVFTGGEPLVHPGIVQAIEAILAVEGARVAVLTNGILAGQAGLDGLPCDRVHFQISLEGPEEVHDALRGKGAFAAAMEGIRALRDMGFSLGVAVAVNEITLPTLQVIPSICAAEGVGSIHLQWHFQRGTAEMNQVTLEVGGREDAPPLRSALVRLYQEARRLGVTVDNFESLAARLFSPPGTRFDLGNACWEALAIGPDGTVYPTPAMVDRPGTKLGHVSEGLSRVWLESPAAEAIRRLSLLDSPEMASDPLRFITGGGDLDHCLVVGPGGGFSLGPDPYRPVYGWMIQEILRHEVEDLPVPERPGMVLKMGEVLGECPPGGEVNFTHCNCLLSVGEGVHGLVQGFYGVRADEPDESILNPIRYSSSEMDFIPEEAKMRMYGCGSPVDAAEPAPGETVVDLGCGTGVECFLASKRVGPAGAVIGVDMTRAMLKRASRACREVSRRLGFANVSFVRGYLEELPLEDGSVDVVISNCVINLSRNKRRVFKEILRILKPGGRLIISDVTTEKEPGPAIRSNHALIGQCLGGALVQEGLFSLLEDVGFVMGEVLARYPYREVDGHRFFSLTFRAYKPGSRFQEAHVLYAGPFPSAIAPDGSRLMRGRVSCLELPAIPEEAWAERGFLLVEEGSGVVANSASGSSCCSCTAPGSDCGEAGVPAQDMPHYQSDCMVCGARIKYLDVSQEMKCVLCGRPRLSSAMCEAGHYVCDGCHTSDPVEWIKRICLSTSSADMVALMKEIRCHPSFSLHGPEHHAMVPGIIMAVYRNLGGRIDEDAIIAAIQRGAEVPGGMCGLAGSCGAAVGAGIGLGAIMGSSPLTPAARAKLNGVVAGILGEIAELPAARCCQRESYISLLHVSRVSKELLGVALPAKAPLACSQFSMNRECIRKACRLYPGASALAGMDEDGGFFIAAPSWMGNSLKR